MSGSPWRRRLSVDWQVVLLSTVLNLLLLAVLAAPVAFLVTGLVEVAHRVDESVPALAYGAVWALVYATGLVRAFVKVELEFSPIRSQPERLKTGEHWRTTRIWSAERP